MLKKNWTGLLGLVFVFISVVYLLRLAYVDGLIPPVALIALGLGLGAAGIVGGYSLAQVHARWQLAAEVTTGLGAGIVYAVLFYAGNAPAVAWPLNAVVICELGLTGLVLFTALRCNMRTLPLVSLVGGLITPLILKAPADQISMLFLYMLVLNCTALVVSALRGWDELKVAAFALTAIVYITYYVHFQPETWLIPFRYVLIFFVVYAVGLMASSWHDGRRFAGLNLYLGIVNAIHFVFWTYLIFHSFEISYAFPIVFVGLVFLASAAVIRRLAPDAQVPALAYAGLGIITLAAGGPGLAVHLETPGLHFVVKGSIWLLLVSIVFVIALKAESAALTQLAIAGWFLILVFWYAVAWEVEWVAWFGVPYIPFVNPGALLWMGLAATGFIMATRQKLLHSEKPDEYLPGLGTVAAVAAHAVVGGLLTVQIQNAWQAYSLSFVPVTLMLTLMWGLYSASLFFWGTLNRQPAFRWAGAAVLVGVSIKALFWDLSGRPTLYKALLVFLLGLVMIGITFIDRSRDEDDRPAEN